MARPKNVVKALQKPPEERTRPTHKVEIGQSVVSPFDMFNLDELYDESHVSLDDLDRMVQTDGQAQSLYRLLTMPLRAGDLRVQVAEGGTQEAAFIRAQFLNPPERGGMTTPWSTVIANIATAVINGASVMEKVWEIRNGYVCLRKLAPRPRRSITIRKDKKGGFDGVKQTLPQGTVTIKKEKCLLFVVNKEFNPLYGRSMLLPAYPHFEMKHKLYYISHLAYALNAIPIREGGLPSNPNELEKQAFKNAIDNVGVKIHDTRQVADSMPLIDHHDIEMAKSVLGQIINLGTTDGGGSYALGETHLEMLLLALQAIREDIAQILNSFVVPELIDWNFGSGKYPTIRLLPPSTDTKVLVKETFQHMSGARQINTSPEFWLRLERAMAEILGFEDEIDYEGQEDAMIQDVKERQTAQSGVAGVGIDKEKVGIEKEKVKIQEKQAATQRIVALKPAPTPVVAPGGARPKPSTSKRTPARAAK